MEIDWGTDCGVVGTVGNEDLIENWAKDQGKIKENVEFQGFLSNFLEK